MAEPTIASPPCAGSRDNLLSGLTKLLLLPLQLLMSWPSLLFLAALTAMLLRHPDVSFYQIDRVAFGCLVVGVVGRTIALRQRPAVWVRMSWPMLGLALMALATVISQPFDQQAWSLLAAKFLVPFTLFHLSQIVFTDQRALKRFEIFALIVLAYLSFTSIAFLVGVHALIFPRFILDDSLGFHADRARGPLLQAVANGVSLNILGLLALHDWRRRTCKGLKAVLLLASVPLAILATMTRAVWLSFAVTVLTLIIISTHGRTRRVAIALALAAGMGVVVVASSTELAAGFFDRLEERGPLDYREAVYAASWQMFLERPLLGWGFHRMPEELPRFVSDYHEKVLYPHNTYLEILVEQGIFGLALYLWLIVELWRLRLGPIPPDEEHGFLDRHFHRMWPLLLAVYWINAAVVVMSYQFVNGLLFTMAGMLAAQSRRAETQPC